MKMNVRRSFSSDEAGNFVPRKKSKSLIGVFKNLFTRHQAEPVYSDTTDSRDLLDGISSKSELSKQEEAWLQACYNAIAFVFVFISGCVLVSVYYVLGPFLQPLMWAVLVGMVLHPFKHMSSSEITQWLQFICKSGMPLSLGAVFTPLFLFNWVSLKLEKIVLGSWKMITGLALGVLSLLLMYILDMPLYVYKALGVGFRSLDTVAALLTAPIYITVSSIVVGFLLLLLLSRGRSKYGLALRVLSCILWFLTLLFLVTSFVGNLAIPAVSSIFILAFVLSWTWKDKSPRRGGKDFKFGWGMEEGEGEGVGRNYLHALLSLSSVSSTYEDGGEDVDGIVRVGIDVAGTGEDLDDSGTTNHSKGGGGGGGGDGKGGGGGDGGGGKGKGRSGKGGGVRLAETSSILKEKDEEEEEGEGEGSKKEKHNVSFKKVEVEAIDQSFDIERSSSEESKGPTSKSSRTILSRRTPPKSGESNNLFVVLLIACFIVFLWKYPLFLILLSPLALWRVLKHIFSYSFTLRHFLRKNWSLVASLIKDRRKILFPPPLPTMVRMFLFVDRAILHLAVKSVGSLVSGFIIVGLLVGLAVFILMLTLGIQAELSHYGNVGTNIWNATLSINPNIAQFLHSSDANGTVSSFSYENFAHQGYEYGRAWIGQKVHSLVSGSGGSTSLVENQIIDLVDKLYFGYFLKDETGRRADHISTESNFMDSSSRALFNELKSLIFNNLETIISILRSLSSIVLENFSIFLSVLYSVLQLLFSGGTALVNMIVFVSALFYLLSSSEEQYLPVKWVMDLLPHLTPDEEEGEHAGSKEQGEAFQRAIRSVFHASLRRAFFYSMYTWLIHTMFGLSVSILPSVLAGIAGAVPFVGPYLISVPAILELWLIESRPLVAIAMLVFSLLPMLFVDDLINREVEGGHSYLTGLSVAGGIYFFGIEGALIGPILLCCLIFFVDVYGDIFNN